jgi:hypothetical protein
VQNEGLASELAARFYEARRFDDIAHLYLQQPIAAARIDARG